MVRATGRRREIDEILNSVRSSQKKGRCFHPDAGDTNCTGGPIRSHTLQKEGALRAIAEDGKVFSVNRGDIAKNHGQIVPALVGIGNASTFPGFCYSHDAMFGPAEQKAVPLNQEVAFLLSYRAVAYETFLKEAALESLRRQRVEADERRPFVEQVRIQQMLHDMTFGTELGLKDLLRSKEKYDVSYRASYRGFKSLVAEFSAVLPVVACGSFSPEFNLFGKKLQSLGEATYPQQIAVNLTVLNERSVLLLGWMDSDNFAEAFASSYSRLPSSEKANAAVRLAIECCENSHVRPSWWNALSPTLKDGLLASFFTMSAPPLCQRGANGFCIDGEVFASGSVIREVSWPPG